MVFKQKGLLKICRVLFIMCLILLNSCKKGEEGTESSTEKSTIETPNNMIWVAGKTFLRGAKETDKFAMPREKPAHKVTVDGFYIDVTEVTNKQYKKFVAATKYSTVAERTIDWEEMKSQLPADTPKPHDSILQPGSLIFNKNINAVVNMNNYQQWWTWKIGADWKHPEGPGSTINGKENYPVVHIALEDALAYCKWANRRLPTEAEWEAAAQGKNTDAIFTWGNDATILDANANTWQGTFPTKNESTDGFEFISAIKSYPANSIGLYDMTGNVWEITSDLFNINHYRELDISKTILNPKGANKSYSPGNPYQIEHVMKGGSFLCHESYCASFRISAKMGVAIDSGSDHVGFRTVATPAMLLYK
ncbi:MULTISPECIES: formylglycine-generating enzyme family protein [unclassified Polaribacter]|uniref:formylglycine-generating enzyme family protein n=1 Tax=unclassified Polaribacter TaxID=196858 RepID=UPI0011BE1ED6|nr:MULTISPECIES: formylglycine-generating enzyme family protein [unclassified Polaribacter]TXD54128.1 formylglycine-generating enzyme family protein [Polaribacter sp. IC063]TXD62393.1 formylglycine-generating enzyme family protein [Polaribacter sp. IC066]